MTRDEIMALEERELDVAVAETVFGWHWTRGRQGGVTDNTVYRWLHPPGTYANFLAATGEEPTLYGSTYDVPKYSTDIVATASIRKEMRRRGYYWTLSDFGNGVKAWFGVLGVAGHEATAQTESEATCRAALLAVVGAS